MIFRNLFSCKKALVRFHISCPKQSILVIVLSAIAAFANADSTHELYLINSSNKTISFNLKVLKAIFTYTPENNDCKYNPWGQNKTTDVDVYYYKINGKGFVRNEPGTTVSLQPVSIMRITITIPSWHQDQCNGQFQFELADVNVSHAGIKLQNFKGLYAYWNTGNQIDFAKFFAINTKTNNFINIANINIDAKK